MRRQISYAAVLGLSLAAMPGRAAEWSKEVPVRDGNKAVVRLRARIAGDFLVVQGMHEPGWHSYAMDNERRAEEKLAGRPSLGIEQGLRVDVESGGKLVGPWYQSPPHDLSRPELQWFTWGFDETATFARRIERTGPGPVALRIGGQACDGRTCRLIDARVTTPPPPEHGRGPEFSTDDLVQVRTEKKADSQDSTSQQDPHP